MENGRNADGTFGTGNHFGVGRPARAVERQYLAALGEMVTLEQWRSVVQKALEDAIGGDARAREWFGRHLLGDPPMKLLTLAADELDGFDADKEIEEARKERREIRFWKAVFPRAEQAKKDSRQE